jgi:hypothetical protein
MTQKIWAFTLKEKLDPQITDDLSAEINSFLMTWDAHGAPVDGELEILHDQILVIKLTTDNTIPSGCSKDKLDKSIRRACDIHGVQILDESNIVVKQNEEEIEIYSRAQFKEFLKSGTLPIDAQLLDYTTLGENGTNSNNLFKPIRDTWAKNLVTN